MDNLKINLSKRLTLWQVTEDINMITSYFCHIIQFKLIIMWKYSLMVSTAGLQTRIVWGNIFELL